jgi:hypothetical protein
MNPWLVVFALVIGYWAGHFEGLRCRCPGPRKVKPEGEVK